MLLAPCPMPEWIAPDWSLLFAPSAAFEFRPPTLDCIGPSPLSSRIEEPAIEDPGPIVEEIVRREAPDPEPEHWAALSLRQKAFLSAYERCGNLLEASEGVCHPAIHFDWLRTNGSYEQAFQSCVRAGQDLFAYQAFELAMNGECVPVLYRGQPVPTADGRRFVQKKRWDRPLLVFLWKQYSPRGAPGS